jgi:hypothetical protein
LVNITTVQILNRNVLDILLARIQRFLFSSPPFEKLLEPDGLAGQSAAVDLESNGVELEYNVPVERPESTVLREVSGRAVGGLIGCCCPLALGLGRGFSGGNF